MANDPLRQMIRTLGKLGGPAGGALSDAQLLERFATSRDEAAFELLLWRHGPMVLGACRRLLADPQDAEDAFQTTFLVLVRKARSVSRGEALSSWLYQVAYRVALRLRAGRAKRAGREQPEVDRLAAPPEDAPGARELRGVLDEEINRLPARQRVAFVLCCLEGKTGEEAARVLGCRPGTVSSRLTRARERLRGRLLRRGLAPAAAAMAAAGSAALAGTLTPTLVSATLKAALLFAESVSAAGAPSAAVVAHVEGVLRAMFLSKLKKAALVVMTLSLLFAGGILTWQALEAQQLGPADPQAPAVQGEKEPAGGKDAQGPIHVEVAKPQPGPLDRTISQNCAVHAGQQAEIFAAVPGTLKQLLVDLGDHVQKGQVLAEIDAPLLGLEEKLAAANWLQAKGQVQEAEAAIIGARAEVEVASTVVTQRQAELQSAEAAITLRQAMLDRMKQLEASKAVDRLTVDEHVERLSAAKAQVAAATAALANAKADVGAKQSKVAQAEAALTTVRAKLEAADIARQKARHLLNLTKLFAPVDGIVTKRNGSPGQQLLPGEPAGQLPLLTILRTGVVRVTVDIPERDVPGATVGVPAELSFAALPGVPFKGLKVTRIGFAVDPKTNAMRAEIDVPSPPPQLRPGMVGLATLHFNKGPAKTLRVPTRSVIHHPKGAADLADAVYVVRAGKAQLVAVQVSYRTGAETEIVAGLLPDDLVVTNPEVLQGVAGPVEVKPGPAGK